MRSFFKLFFRKNKQKTVAEKLKEAALGNTVSVYFVDPRSMGYLHIADALSRFDEDDIAKGKVTGQITDIRIDPVMDLFILTITSAKPYGRIRSYILLQNEIKNIEFLDKE